MSGSERATWLLALGLLAVPAGLAAQAPVAEPAPPPPGSRIERDMGWGSYSISVLPMRRALLGVTASVEPQPTDSLGALLTAVTPGGPADRAGLRSGDLIVRLDGTSLVEGRPAGLPMMQVPAGLRLVELAARLSPNDTVAVEYRRGGRRHTTTLVTSPTPGYVTARVTPEAWVEESERSQQLARMLNERQRDLERIRTEADRVQSEQRTLTRAAPRAGNLVWLRSAGPLAGLELVTVNPSLESYFGTDRGILVVKANDPAPFGLRGGDVILAVDGREPSSASHLYRILATYTPRETVKLDVIRKRRPMVLTASLTEPIPEP